MAENDIICLPVVDAGRLAGMVSDRDIVLHVFAEGRGASTCVRDVMSPTAHCCIDDEDVDEVLPRMAALASDRLPGVDHDGKLVDILIRR
jgi:CBS domain-containing protein